MEQQALAYVPRTVTAICARCRLEKPATEFTPNRRGPRETQSWCRPCFNEVRRARYASDEQFRKQHLNVGRRWRESSGYEEYKARLRERYAADPGYRQRIRDQQRQLSKDKWDKNPIWREEKRKQNNARSQIARKKTDGLSRVYFIAAPESGFVKIGFTKKRLDYRLIELQIGCFEELALLGWLPGGKAVEHELHSQFASLRVRGEWFRLDDRLKEFIASNTEQRYGLAA